MSFILLVMTSFLITMFLAKLGNGTPLNLSFDLVRMFRVSKNLNLLGSWLPFSLLLSIQGYYCSVLVNDSDLHKKCLYLKKKKTLLWYVTFNVTHPISDTKFDYFSCLAEMVDSWEMPKKMSHLLFLFSFAV